MAYKFQLGAAILSGSLTQEGEITAQSSNLAAGVDLISARNLQGNGTLSLDGGTNTISAAELNRLDGATAGNVVANKAVIASGAKAILGVSTMQAETAMQVIDVGNGQSLAKMALSNSVGHIYATNASSQKLIEMGADTSGRGFMEAKFANDKLFTAGGDARGGKMDFFSHIDDYIGASISFDASNRAVFAVKQADGNPSVEMKTDANGGKMDFFSHIDDIWTISLFMDSNRAGALTLRDRNEENLIKLNRNDSGHGRLQLYNSSGAEVISLRNGQGTFTKVVSAAGFKETAQSLNSNATVNLDNGYIVLATPSVGGMTLTLPASTAASGMIKVKKTNSSADTVTIAAAGGQSIDGVASIVLESSYAAVGLIPNGTSGWYVV